MGGKSDNPSVRGSAPRGAGAGLAAADAELQARLVRITRGLSFAEIARITGCHRETCRRYLTHGSPTIEFLSALCGAQGISVHWLLSGSGPMSAFSGGGDWLKSVDRTFPTWRR